MSALGFRVTAGGRICKFFVKARFPHIYAFVCGDRYTDTTGRVTDDAVSNLSETGANKC